MQTVLRYLLMLRHIPKQPQKIDVSTLRERLSEHGVDVSIRTIQRNLIELSEFFPLTTDERTKPYGWSLLAEAPLLPLIDMTRNNRMLNGVSRNGLPPGPAVNVELRCERNLKRQLEAYPLNTSQLLELDHDGVTLRAEAELSEHLLIWILSHGAQMEVKAPAELRQEVAAQAKAMYEFYYLRNN
ncbi:WYL domain-containing protein [Pseudidiomarina insulisalsae]|nr:WYL domain-containing protein [Pseudidiomarina insulisalsae]